MYQGQDKQLYQIRAYKVKQTTQKPTEIYESEK